MDMSLPVTLIVKAPNQQFEDQTIKCEITWTIKRLKGYLSEVYPCKPSTDEQKLIYSGQLLGDSVVLKDILRQYEGQETHTVHLVYTPKNRNYYNKPMSNQKSDTKSTNNAPSQPSVSNSSTTATSTDGLRHRTVPASTTTAAPVNITQPQATPFNPYVPGLQQSHIMPVAVPFNLYSIPLQQQPSTSSTTTAAAGPQFNPYNPHEYVLAQQIAMQQMMQQQQSFSPFNSQEYVLAQQMAMQQMMQYYTGSQMNYPSMPYYPQNVPGYTPNVAQPATPNPYQSMAEQFAGQEANGAGAAAAAAAAAAPQPAPQQFLRPGNLDDENENRDWLEIFYTFSRLIVLLSLVYFYSSPIRCSIVIFVMILYYLYHTNQRTLRERQQRAAELAEALRRNATQAAADGTQADQAAAQPGENANDITAATADSTANDETLNETAATSGSNHGEGTSTATTPDSVDGEVSTATTTASTTPTTESAEQDDNNRLPTITLLRTFVLSFFASLIPETPAV